MCPLQLLHGPCAIAALAERPAPADSLSQDCALALVPLSQMGDQWWEQRLDARIQEEDAVDARFEEKRIGIHRTSDEVVRRIRALTEMDDTTRKIVCGLNFVVG